MYAFQSFLSNISMQKHLGLKIEILFQIKINYKFSLNLCEQLTPFKTIITIQSLPRYMPFKEFNFKNMYREGMPPTEYS